MLYVRTEDVQWNVVAWGREFAGNRDPWFRKSNDVNADVGEENHGQTAVFVMVLLVLVTRDDNANHVRSCRALRCTW